MNKYFLIIILCFTLINISAQTENNTNADEEEIMYIDADIDSDVAPAKPIISTSSRNFLKQGNNRKLYKVKPLYKNFDWIQLKKDKKTGVIKEGKIFLPLVFSAELKQKGRQIILSYKGQQGVYDLDLNKWIIPTISDWIEILNPDLFAVRTTGGFFQLVNSQMETLRKTDWVRFDKSSINSNHFIIKSRNNLYGLYDKKSKKVIFEPIHNSFKIENGQYLISKNGVNKNILNSDASKVFEKWVQNIQKVIDPNTGKRPKYLGGLDSTFDYYIVGKDGKKGLIRNDSKVLIPFEYKDILYRGYFWSQNEAGKWGVTNGEKNIIPFKYDEIFRLSYVRSNNNYFQLLKIRIGNKFGLYQNNSKSKSLHLLAECKYKNIRIESHGAIVQYPDNKYQLINYDTKKPVFKNKKEAIIQCYQNSLIVKDKKNWSLVNQKGVNRTKQVYKYLQNFHFYIIAQNSSGKFGILSNKGKIILPFEYQNIFSLDEDKSTANIFVIKKGGKYGLFNAYEKKIKTEFIYDNVFKDSQNIYLTKGDDFFEARAFGGGEVKKRENFVPTKKEIGLNKDLFITKFTPGYEDFFGLYDFKKKDWILPLGYKYIIEIKEDLFLIKKNNEPVAFVNSKGKLIKNTDWMSLTHAKQIKDKFHHFYIKNKDGLLGIYDSMNDKVAFPCVYDKISIDPNVSNHYLLKKSESSNYANFEGKLMFPDDDILILKRVRTSSILKYFTFKKNGKIGLIRSDGKIIVSQNFSNVKIESNTIWLQNSNGKWGFLNQENDQVLFDFDEFKLIQSKDGKNYFQVKKEEKAGIIVKEKNSITIFLEIKYKSIKCLSGLIIVETASGYRVLDYNKKEIFENNIESIRFFFKSFFVKINNQWFMINSKGEKIIEEGFEELANFSKGISTNHISNTYAKYKSVNQKFGLINAEGKKITEPIFDDIVYRIVGGFIMVKNGEKLRWYHIFKHEYASDIEFDYFFEHKKKVYCISSDKWYYTANSSSNFKLKKIKIPTNTN